jgi:hypothetical protein
VVPHGIFFLRSSLGLQDALAFGLEGSLLPLPRSHLLRSDPAIISTLTATDCTTIVAPFLAELHCVDDLRLDFYG